MAIAFLNPTQSHPVEFSSQAQNDVHLKGAASSQTKHEGPLEADNAEPDDPAIRDEPGKVEANLLKMEHCLVKSGRHYQRGGQIVTVRVDPGSHETHVDQVNKASLLRDLDHLALWERFDARATVWVRTRPSDRLCALLLGGQEFKVLPVLNGLALQPFLRSDGTVSSCSGYDPRTGFLGVFDAKSFCIPSSVTPAQAEAALVVLEGLLDGFAFESECDRSAALSAMLTASTRPSLQSAPMFHVRAHQSGTGKSYLCELITAFATSQRGAPVSFPRGEDECGKLLLSELRSKPAVIEFDNLTTDLAPFPSLCTALTSEGLSGRLLGSSRTLKVTTRTLMLSSGNNVGPVADMNRRCITINLDAQCEMPAGRQFANPHLVKDVLSRRGEYVSAAQTVISGWVQAGRPQAQCKPFVSFGDWTDLCRQPLLWLGRADPATSVFNALSRDPERETLGSLLVFLEHAFKGSNFMVKDITKIAVQMRSRDDSMFELLHEVAEERDGISQKRLGHWLKRHSGEIVGGLRLVTADVTRNAKSWKVESVLSVLSVASTAAPENQPAVDSFDEEVEEFEEEVECLGDLLAEATTT